MSDVIVSRSTTSVPNPTGTYLLVSTEPSSSTGINVDELVGQFVEKTSDALTDYAKNNPAALPYAVGAAYAAQTIAIKNYEQSIEQSAATGFDLKTDFDVSVDVVTAEMHLIQTVLYADRLPKNSPA